MHFELSFWHDSDGYQVAIFSDSIRDEDIWDAIGERYWLMPQGWTGSEFDTWMLHGRVRHEREACARCVEGIGIYDPVIGWTILPIDYAAIELDPPDQHTLRRSKTPAQLKLNRIIVGDNWHVW